MQSILELIPNVQGADFLCVNFMRKTDRPTSESAMFLFWRLNGQPDKFKGVKLIGNDKPKRVSDKPLDAQGIIAAIRFAGYEGAFQVPHNIHTAKSNDELEYVYANEEWPASDLPPVPHVA